MFYPIHAYLGPHLPAPGHEADPQDSNITRRIKTLAAHCLLDSHGIQELGLLSLMGWAYLERNKASRFYVISGLAVAQLLALAFYGFGRGAALWQKAAAVRQLEGKPGLKHLVHAELAWSPSSSSRRGLEQLVDRLDGGLCPRPLSGLVALIDEAEIIPEGRICYAAKAIYRTKKQNGGLEAAKEFARVMISRVELAKLKVTDDERRLELATVRLAYLSAELHEDQKLKDLSVQMRAWYIYRGHGPKGDNHPLNEDERARAQKFTGGILKVSLGKL